MGRAPGPRKRHQIALDFAPQRLGYLEDWGNGLTAMSKAREMDTEDVLRVELEVLKTEHRDLDAAITALAERAVSDQLTISRLKKQKLSLKDKISRIEDKLTPDIIA